MKYYVVWVGRSPGIYATWADCRAQVHGFAEAKYKSFASRVEAEAAFRGPVPIYPKFGKTRWLSAPTEAGPTSGIAVDAACSGNPGVVEYRGVDLATGEMVFSEGPLDHGTNNLGEFLAIVQAMKWLTGQGRTDPIYSDSKVAIGWVKRRALNSPWIEANPDAELSRRVHAALAWLDRHNPHWDIRKWNTATWGETPADYGRK